MESVKPVVDQERCTACGTCVEACRFEVLKLRKRGADPCGIGSCLVCGACVAVCPVGAVQHPLMPAERIVELPERAPVGYAELMDLLRHRRSIRRYTEEPVTADELRALVEAAILAPSSHNSQPWHFTFVSASERLATIREAVAEFYRRGLAALKDEAGRTALGEQAVRMLSLMAPALQLLIRAHDRGDDRLLWGAPALGIIHAPREEPAAESSCLYAAANMQLAATALGLGTCLIGFLIIPLVWGDAATRAAVGLPEGHNAYAAMAIGHPKLRYRRSVVRREPPITII